MWRWPSLGHHGPLRPTRPCSSIKLSWLLLPHGELLSGSPKRHAQWIIYDRAHKNQNQKQTKDLFSDVSNYFMYLCHVSLNHSNLPIFTETAITLWASIKYHRVIKYYHFKMHFFIWSSKQPHRTGIINPISQTRRLKHSHQVPV